MRNGAGTYFLAGALNIDRHKCLLLGFRANGSFGNAVYLVTCSGYHVAAFSVVFSFFFGEPACGSALHPKSKHVCQAHGDTVDFQRLLLRFI